MTRHTPKSSPLSFASQRGLSLIELMISITIGLLILVSLSSLFINQSRARAELDKSNRMIDNGRYALELLSSNLRMAGFYGRYEPSGAPVTTVLPDPCDATQLTTSPNNLDIMRLHVQGYDAAGPTSQITTPPCSLTNVAGAVLSLKPGSDILTMRRTAVTAYDHAAAVAANLSNGTVYLQVTSCQWQTPTYLMSTNLNALHLAQKNVAGNNNCLNIGGILTITAPWEAVRPFLVETYFVSPDNTLGDGIPTLKRRELSYSSGNPVFITTPLVEGIEFMQVEYGIDDPTKDTDGIGGVGLDGVPDSYVTCSPCSTEEWSNVVSLKLHLIARNIEPTKGHNDAKTYTLGSGFSYIPSGTAATYKRHAYTQVIRLVNPSGRREAS